MAAAEAVVTEHLVGGVVKGHCDSEPLMPVAYSPRRSLEIDAGLEEAVVVVVAAAAAAAAVRRDGHAAALPAPLL